MQDQIDKVDKLVLKMEKALERVDAFQGSRVKLPKAELDLLKCFEESRDLMLDLMKTTSSDRSKLEAVFGGDCTRIARIQCVLDNSVFSDMNANDQRIKTCKEACKSVEHVLEDMGLGMQLKKAMGIETEDLAKRRTTMVTAEVAEQAAKMFAAEQEAEENKRDEEDCPAEDISMVVVQKGDVVATIQLSPNDLAGDLRTAISAECSPQANFRMVFKGKDLNDGASLGSQGLSDNSVVDLEEPNVKDIELVINLKGKEVVRVTIKPSLSVGELRKEITAKKVPGVGDDFRMLLQGKDLKDALTLTASGLTDGKTIEVEPRAAEVMKKKNLIEEQWAKCVDETLCERICACTAGEELAPFEEQVTKEKAAKIGNWMIWMVHRAHVNDPTLKKLDFTNLKMPNGDFEPRVAPKLMLAIEENTELDQMLIACSNFQNTEAAVLGVSLAKNRTLKIINIDSNVLQAMELESICKAAGMNGTLQELRCNGVASGRMVFEAVLDAVKKNSYLIKVGIAVTEPHFRNQIDGQITKNNDATRKRRNEAKKAAEAGYNAAQPPAAA